jgi:MoaA/NifB/PqqE/SkfB family radical SAM enzyme
MITIDYIKKIELEITSDCNAACPGCARTQHFDKFNIESLTLNDLKRLFPNRTYIENKMFKFCGVLGDPAKHSEMVDMIEYFSSNGGNCEVSTNGGIQSSKWWKSLGELTQQYPGQIYVHFCVDGHKETNHIYRVNTKFSVIERNIKAFADHAAPNSAKWVYIVFDHNEHELDAAKKHADELGFEFSIRTGMRNSYHNWVSKIRKKEDKQLKIEEKIITTTGKKEHSKKQEVEQLDKFIHEYKNKHVTETEIKAVTDTITCKYVHEGEIFIASDLTLWPCCFLWDSKVTNKELISEKLAEYGGDWNSLKTNAIEGVLEHPWYKEVLELSWNPYHNKHFSRCVRTCAKNKAYQNEFKNIK